MNRDGSCPPRIHVAMFELRGMEARFVYYGLVYILEGGYPKCMYSIKGYISRPL